MFPIIWINNSWPYGFWCVLYTAAVTSAPVSEYSGCSQSSICRRLPDTHYAYAQFGSTFLHAASGDASFSRMSLFTLYRLEDGTFNRRWILFDRSGTVYFPYPATYLNSFLTYLPLPSLQTIYSMSLRVDIIATYLWIRASPSVSALCIPPYSTDALMVSLSIGFSTLNVIVIVWPSVLFLSGLVLNSCGNGS